MAGNNLRDVPVVKPERCRLLKGDKKGLFAVDLTHPFRLAFAPNHEPVPKMKDGGIYLAKITAITIINVEDCH
ncbi:MAG: killer suppression protein HigA [Candidatus Anammoxibacter sp.]